MAKLIIMIGIPGSGKSSFVKKHFSDAIVCSADHFFEDDDGNYNFDPRKIGEAHAACQNKFIRWALSYKSNDTCVIDNTNLTKWERQIYLNTAVLTGIEIEIHQFVCKTDEDILNCANRNSHGVPVDAVKAMHCRYEEPNQIDGHKYSIVTHNTNK